MEVSGIRGDLRELLQRTLRREYFFEELAGLYERVAVQRSACTKEQCRGQLAGIRLDERVEAALAKAARVWQPERQGQRVVNVQVLAPFWVRRKEWERNCRITSARIERGTEQAANAQQTYMQRISHRRNPPLTPSIDSFIVTEIASYRLLQQALEVFSESETIPTLTRVAGLKATSSLEQAQSCATILHICDWTQSLLTALRETATDRAYLEQLPSLGKLRKVKVLDDYESDYLLLTHLKHIHSLSDLTKVLSVYTAASIYQLRRIPLSFCLAPSLPLPVLRLLHSLVAKSAASLLTVAPSSP